MDFICPAIGATIILPLVVIVGGHYVWVFLAKVLRGGRPAGSSSPSPAPAYQRPTRCPHCGHISIPPVCASCGRDKRTDARSARTEDLVATRRQLNRFREQGLLDDMTHRRLLEAIDNERERLTGTAAPPAAPSTVTPTATPPPRPVPPPAQTPSATPPPLVTRPPQAPLAPSPVPPPRPAPPPPAEPRRPLSDVFASFMAERNIRWGELVGGMLIVLSSIALVINFWSQIAQTPVIKFFIFTGVTAALFGVGLYTEHRWKLPTTSRGILIIATLLVPLNYLAIAAFAEAPSVNSVMVISGEIVALLLFTALVFYAGRVITSIWPALLTVGVVGSAASQFIVRRLADPQMSQWTIWALGLLCLAGYAIASGWMIVVARRWRAIGSAKSTAMFMLIGSGLFAAVLPLGLLTFKSGSIASGLRQAAPIVTLYGLPLLVSGLILWQKVHTPKLVISRTAGAAIAVVGALILLVSVGLGWPHPSQMLPTAVLVCIVLTIVAVVRPVPAAHLLAVGCGVLAYLLAFHWWRTEGISGHVEQAGDLARALLSGRSGQALVWLFIALSGACTLLERLRRRPDLIFYAVATAAVAVVSIVLITWHGFLRTDELGATWIYAFYAVVAFVSARLVRRSAASWAGAALLLAAVAQGVYCHRDALHLTDPWTVALLGYATLTAAGAVAVSLAGAQWRDLYRAPLMWAALAASIGAAVLLLVNMSVAGALPLWIRTLWLAGVWLVLAYLRSSAVLFSSFQVAMYVTVALAAVAGLSQRPWFAEQSNPLWHEWTVQSIGFALAGLSLLWMGLRVMWPHAPLTSAGVGLRGLTIRFMYPRWPSVDDIATIVVIVGHCIMAGIGAAAGVAQEFARSAEASESVFGAGRALHYL